MTPAVRRARRISAWMVRAVVNLLLITVTLAAVGYLLPTFLGYERYVITGGSMSGTFEKGSIAFEKPVPVADLEVGDVITYLPPPGSGVSDLVTHRIVEIDAADGGGRLFRTQGDANPDPDPWTFTLTQPEQPVVTYTVPLVGHAFIALADRETRMVVIGVPAALVALASLLELVGALRSRRRTATAPHLPAPQHDLVASSSR